MGRLALKTAGHATAKGDVGAGVHMFEGDVEAGLASLQACKTVQKRGSD